MSDAVAVAAITAGVGVAGNFLTWLAARRQAEVSISNAEQSARVEITKLEAEAERLRAQFRESERQGRKETYQRFIARADRLHSIARGDVAWDAGEHRQLVDELQELHGPIHPLRERRGARGS